VSSHHKFANGFGASVVTNGYGGDEDFFELAVLDSDGEECYETPVTSDVLGWLTAADVKRILGEIEALPTNSKDKCDEESE